MEILRKNILEINSFIICWLRAHSRLLLNSSGNGQPKSQATREQSLSLMSMELSLGFLGVEMPLSIL